MGPVVDLWPRTMVLYEMYWNLFPVTRNTFELDDVCLLNISLHPLNFTFATRRVGAQTPNKNQAKTRIFLAPQSQLEIGHWEKNLRGLKTFSIEARLKLRCGCWVTLRFVASHPNWRSFAADGFWDQNWQYLNNNICDLKSKSSLRIVEMYNIF